MYGEPQNFSDLVSVFIDLITLVLPLIFSITLLVIIWRVVNTWILNVDNESKREEGRNTILVGVIVLVVMSGIWGIVALLRYSIFDI
jgi:hypothetical protein